MPTFDEVEKSRYDGSRFELYKFETADNRFEKFYTTGESTFEFDNEFYEPEAISRDEVGASNAEGSGQRLTINVPWTNPVAALHVPYMPPRPVRVTVYAVQRHATGIDVVQCFIGEIVSFSQKGPEVQFQCSHIIDSQQQRVPWVPFKSGCVWTVYGVGCGVGQAPFENVVQAGTYSISGDTVNSPLFLAKSIEHAAVDPNWFRAGKLFNPQTGELRFITEHSGANVRLRYPFTRIDVQSMDLIAIAGCDLTERICRLKFNNKKNMLSFDHMPDYNVFDGGVRT